MKKRFSKVKFFKLFSIAEEIYYFEYDTLSWQVRPLQGFIIQLYFKAQMPIGVTVEGK